MFIDFENFFSEFINICLEFNKKYKLNHNSFIHIKGGASVKYQLNLENSTNDIDLFFYGDFNNFHDFLFQNYECYYKNMDIESDKGLIKLIFDKKYNVDISIYNSNFIFDYSIFFNGLKKIGFENGHKYFSYISNIKNINENTIKELTFTSLELEKYCITYALEYYNDFINKGIPFRINFIKENPNSLITNRYIKEVSNDYKLKIINKINRYENRLNEINKYFGIYKKRKLS